MVVTRTKTILLKSEIDNSHNRNEKLDTGCIHTTINPLPIIEFHENHRRWYHYHIDILQRSFK